MGVYIARNQKRETVARTYPRAVYLNMSPYQEMSDQELHFPPEWPHCLISELSGSQTNKRSRPYTNQDI